LEIGKTDEEGVSSYTLIAGWLQESTTHHTRDQEGFTHSQL
jgi:hypothetical protein